MVLKDNYSRKSDHFDVCLGDVLRSNLTPESEVADPKVAKIQIAL